MRRRLLLILVLALALPLVASAQQPIRDSTSTKIAKACDTDGETLAAANSGRTQIALFTTSGTGTVFIVKGAKTADATNWHIMLKQAGPASMWNDDGDSVVYSGQLDCFTLSGTVFVGGYED